MFIFAIFLLLLFIYSLTNYIKVLGYWKKKGLKYLTPLPVIGNTLPILLQTVSPAEFIVRLYNAYPKERYFGVFQFGQPILFLRDPELIGTITVKEFDSFSDHAVIFTEELDKFWGKNLFASEGKRWKDLRQTLSPVFTSSKLKYMYVLMEDCTKQFIEYIKEENPKVTEWDVNDLFKKFTMDVIATTAFGLKCNTLTEKDNEFYRMGREFMDFTGIKKLKFILYGINPYIAKILNVKMVTDNVSRFFHSIIKQTLEIRAKENIFRPDLINQLIEARKENLNHEHVIDANDSFTATKETYIENSNKQFALNLTDEDITAQSLVFIFGGFESTSSLINFSTYELAVNPDIQERLRKEVDTYLTKCDGKITYEVLLKMEYLDMVVTESLRKWPPSPVLDRKVGKPFTIEPEREGEKPVHLQPGDICWMPVFALHRDPQYWPNPDVFNPERFSGENRSKIHPSTFITFGAGPRKCIGSRYAIILTKLLLVNLLANFEIEPSKKTQVPLVISNDTFMLSAVHGFHLNFIKRTNNIPG